MPEQALSSRDERPWSDGQLEEVSPGHNRAQCLGSKQTLTLNDKELSVCVFACSPQNQVMGRKSSFSVVFISALMLHSITCSVCKTHLGSLWD